MTKICPQCHCRRVMFTRDRTCRECKTRVEAFYRRRQKVCAITDSTRGQVIERDGMNCRYCGRRVFPGRRFANDSIEIDHVVSRKAGGWGRVANLVVSCRWCNHRKESQERYRHRVFDVLLRAESDSVIRGIYEGWGRN